MTIRQSENKFLWYVVGKDNKIIRIAHSKIEAMEIMKRIEWTK